MRYLLDTHAFIWFILDHSNLSTIAKVQIEDNHNEFHRGKNKSLF